MTNTKSGKIIPFQQGASFYMKRGAKEMEKNDLLRALSRYRLASLSAPDDPEPQIAMSEILSQMQRFEESNAILFALMSAGKGTPECYFGLACNYFGMREYDYAAESLENYLDADPDGPFALEAEDFLDFIDDDASMREATGLATDQDFDDSASCVFSKHLMSAGDFAGAVSELRHQVIVSPDSLPVREQLAIALFCNGDRAGAEALCRDILKTDPDDVHARCTLALALHAAGDEAGAKEQLRLAGEVRTDDPEELNNLSTMQLELSLYEDAMETMKKLLTKLPYDENVLHKCGLCAYALGDYKGAQDCYKRLLKIRPGDTVAKYYLAQSRKTGLDEHAIRARWLVAYQVPFSEAFRRLNQLNRLLMLPDAELVKLWREDLHFRQLVEWGLSLPEQRVKKSILSLLYTFQDEHAVAMLRDYLLRTDQPDDLKRIVFGALKRLRVPEPYMAYLNGQWIAGSVNMLAFPYALPEAYDNVVQMLLQYMVGARDEKCVTVAARIYHRYIESLHEKFPRISMSQQLSIAAALELLACRVCSVPATESELIEAYRVSGTRLRNALKKLEPFAEGLKEEEEKDTDE